MPAPASRFQIAATRLSFFAAGVAVAAWGPLVPYAAKRLGAGDDLLGMMLLCLGLGSIVAMPVTGALADRFGCRRIITASAACMLALLPFLAVASTPGQLGAALFLFGASVGTVDVAMNIQAVIVEQRAGRSLMSAFHGFFSLGGLCGAGAMSGLLHAGLPPLGACLAVSALLAALFAVSYPGLLAETDPARPKAPVFAIPRGSVILVCLLCFVIQVIEGSVIDWSAMFLTKERGVEPSLGGVGYVCFAAAMTLGRFFGDALVNRAGGRRVLAAGSVSVALGFVLVAGSSSLELSVGGFVLIGLGASNLVPILCSASGRQQAMPPGHAVAAIVTFGYSGLMAGPALIGFAAQQTSLGTAFLGLGATALLVAAAARLVRASDA